MRRLAYPVLAVLGAAVAVAGALVQAAWFPGGLILALAGSAALFWGGGRLTGGRVGAVVPAAVWLLTVIFLSSARPEGDFLFANGLSPYIYLLGGAMAGVMSATLAQPGPPGGGSLEAR
ncbi:MULTISPECIES: DUF6113 family protein [unclassified Streptomyces]|uniref:DUF6113 family protein n=1 Tax=unclassified Streptomyces TaxID=2593676 RepID=UPI0033CF070C